ncbi:MAG: glycosyltransferase family 1 protein, partial [Thermomicrobiaceae bacterium]
IHPRKSIVTIHDLGYLHEPGSHTRASRIQLRLTTQWNARKAKHLIAISESTRQDLIEHCQVDPARVSVIRHGVEPAFRELDESEVRRYRIAARLPERFVLYLGTIQPRKNLVRLIDAFEQIAHDDLEVELVLAGRNGWLAKPIRQHASSSHFRDRIRFLGHVPDEQLPLLYNAATCVALPSLYEGFGLPALEAQACGVPALVSNRGALPELAGADMVIADPERTDEIAAGLVTLCRQRHVREQIDRRIEHAAEFSWVNSAAQTRQLFEEVLEE